MNENEEPNKIMRGKIEGRTLYCRVPIRLRRIAISQRDIGALSKYQEKHNYTDEQMLEKAFDISEMGDTYWAGKIYSYIDRKNGQPYAEIVYEEEQEG